MTYGLGGEKLWDSLADSGMDIGGSCGGNGLCGKCKLRVEGDTNPVSDKERNICCRKRSGRDFVWLVTVMFRLLKGLPRLYQDGICSWRYHPLARLGSRTGLNRGKAIFIPAWIRKTRFPCTVV